jgi:hypothetical protein
MLIRLALASVLLTTSVSGHRAYVGSVVDFKTISDDDIARHSDDQTYFDGIEIREKHFAENGFKWHIIRFANTQKPEGPTWVVLHDDENAAFESMIAGMKRYGGVGIAVNSGSGSARKQGGRGTCGGRQAVINTCDPNRNFSNTTPLFTGAVLGLHMPNQPVIAFHTNSPGFEGNGQGGGGDVTILDTAAFRNGNIRPRAGGIFGANQPAELANYDTLGIIPFRAAKGMSDQKTKACGVNLSKAGVHFWAENVSQSDGSLSNYIILNRPDIAYFNAESRREADISIASASHMLMIAAYLKVCH